MRRRARGNCAYWLTAVTALGIGSAVRIALAAVVLSATALPLVPTEASAQTPGMERRGDRRDDRQAGRGARQDGRQEGRAAKQACKAAGESRAECRQTKRATKQAGRQEGRSIRQEGRATR